MTFDERFIALYRSGNLAACNVMIREAPPGRDSDERCSIAYWRSVLLNREGKPMDALSVLDAASSDFQCKCALALKRAQLLRSLDRIPEAIATLHAAPISQEVTTYPGLAWEAAYFGCYLAIQQGETAPGDWLDLIPEDFETMIDDEFVFKQNLIDRKF
jgi:hypothetical protein